MPDDIHLTPDQLHDPERNAYARARDATRATVSTATGSCGPIPTATAQQMFEAAQARRAQTHAAPDIDAAAEKIAACAVSKGDARAAYEYLDELTLAVGRALKRRGL